MKKVAIVTGGSSGIGFAVVSLLAARGYSVTSFSRREGVDLTDSSAVDVAIERVLKQEGRIDLVVNNAGVGAFGAAEFASEESIRRQFEVNFFSAVSLVRKVLPTMRAQGEGRIINVASAAAMFPLPFQSFYSATKAALVNWSRALAGEVRPFGVCVSVVCPGDVKTGFTDARKLEVDASAEYRAAASRALAKASASERGGMRPEAIARKIVRLAEAKHPPIAVVPGLGYAMLDYFARLLPRTWVSKLISRFYL